MPKPGFIIIGAQKCGTTSLSEYLGYHAKIAMSYPKEPGYFATDFPGIQFISTEPEYLDLFKELDPGQIGGEASASYLNSKEAVKNIHDFDESMKLIVMLRNPIDLVYSFHSQLLYSFEEDQEDFRIAWQLQEERKEGRAIPPQNRVPEYLLYREIGLLGDQVERVLNIFPRERLHIIFFEDFVKNTRSSYRGALEFLEVPDDGRDDFPRLNPQKKHRFPRIMSMISRKPPWLQELVDRGKKLFGARGESFIQSFYAKKSKRIPLDSEMREVLRSEFEADVRKLSDLTGRDLSHWK